VTLLMPHWHDAGPRPQSAPASAPQTAETRSRWHHLCYRISGAYPFTIVRYTVDVSNGTLSVQKERRRLIVETRVVLQSCFITVEKFEVKDKRSQRKSSTVESGRRVSRVPSSMVRPWVRRTSVV
jgi:hypothetical protein